MFMTEESEVSDPVPAMVETTPTGVACETLTLCK